MRISVRDHGPGIPPEFHQRIFEKFAQADASNTRQSGGTGLGLAISRELVERMGGRIGFDSRPGEGACFFFELPVCEAGEDVTGLPRSGSEPAGILIPGKTSKYSNNKP